MIEYTLNCEQGHRFEGWFPNSSEFESQRDRKLVSCPFCDSTKIDRALMTPHLGNNAGKARGNDEPLEQQQPVAPAKSQATVPAALSQPQMEKMQQIYTAMREVQTHVKANFDDVGQGLAEEARKMHYGESEVRGIYGQASADEVEELGDEGITILPLPDLPELDS